MYDKVIFQITGVKKKGGGHLIFQYHFLHNTDRVNFKWIWNLNIKRETRIILEENMGEFLCNMHKG